ncbi:MAG: PspC protein [Glaciihabitans sp.]|nr:PspC protein [Glaciihabitans sp.]
MPENTPPPSDFPTADSAQSDSAQSSAAAGSESGPESNQNNGTVPPTAPTGNRFFAWMRGLDVQRQPGWIGGVSAGIAVRLGIDPLIVRGIFVVVAVLGGPALLLYAAAWLLLPDVDDKIHLEELFRGRLESPVVGVGVVVLLAMLPITQGFWLTGAEYWGEPSWGASIGRATWTILVLAAIVAFVVWMSRRSNAPTAASPAKPGAPAPGGYPFADAARATAANATAAFTSTGAAAGPVPPPAPAVGAPAEEVAAWRERQALWKQQHNAFRQQQAGERQAAAREAQEKARVERNARYAADRARRAKTRSNPLYTFIVVGVALIAGAVVALTMTGSAVDTITQNTLVLSLAVTLAVLALGIVVNGMRGKRGGGSTAFAIVALIVLVSVASFPRGNNIALVADTTFTPQNSPGSQTQDFATGFGDVTLDLSDYYSDSDALADTPGTPDHVQLVVGAGEVTVILPEDEYLTLSSNVGFGEVTGSNAIGQNSDYGPRSSSSTMSLSPEGKGDWDSLERYLTIDVELGAGSITVIDPSEGALR